jgi:KTSC domain-containing protein
MGRVESSVIRDYEYDGSAQVLYVTFVSGKTYAYDRVPPDVYDAFEAAGSKGKFFNRYIRDHYRYVLVTLPRP